ncbi:hypothetical protein HQ531_03570 [bacterium]|nr:hypothetical protein [bacterium]
MRVRFEATDEREAEEYQISGINPAPKNTVAGGRYVARNGIMMRGVEDITEYQIVDGEKVEVVPDPTPESISVEI